MSRTVTDTDVTTWPRKREAAALLEVSEKTIDRLAERGQLAKRDLPEPGTSKTYPVYDPEKILALRSQKGLATETVNGHPAPQPQRLLPAPEPSTPGKRVRLPLRDLRLKVYLSTEEAVRYTGLPKWYVHEMANQGKVQRLENMRPTRFRRADLEKL